jgi:hypothetical protein
MDDDQYRLLHAAFEKFWNFSTSLFVVRDKDEVLEGQPRYEYRGSGTFVLMRDYPCLLTAGHVWDRALRHYAKLLFSIAGEKPAMRITRDKLKVLYCSPRLTRNEEQRQGPDLALIGLPEECVERLKAMGKSFYNLAKRREAALSSGPSTNQFRVLIGTPGEWVAWKQSERPDLMHAQVGASLIISRVRAAYQRDPWDYVDLSIHDRRGDNFPADYRGMSGSGLWRVGVEAGNQLTWDSTAFLDGVAFYWDDTGPPEEEVLRSHGPRSIYEVLPSLI